MSSHDRILSAYPGLLPGFFTLPSEQFAPMRLSSHRAWNDPSEPPAHDAFEALRWQYLEACARAISVLLEHADAVNCGSAVIVTASLSTADFDTICALGEELIDLENCDPREDDDPAEAEQDDEQDGRDLPFVFSQEETM